MLFAIIGVVVAGLLGGAYIAYSKGYLAIPGLTPKTDQLFDKMVDSISDVKNAQYSLRMSIKSEPRSTKATQIFIKNSNNNTNANINAATNSNSAVISNTNAYMIEDVGSQIGLGSADLAGSLLGMNGLSDADEFFKTFPADIDLSGGIMLYFEADKKLSVANGSFRIDGTYTGGDASVAIDLEARKKNTDLYGIVNKFPSFFGIDPSGIKGKWIKLNSGDFADSFDPESLDKVDTQEIVTGLKTNLKRALQQKLFTVQQKLPAETIGGIKSEHYLIKIDTTKIVDVYNAFIEEERAKGTDVKQFEVMRDEIQKPENMATLGRIVDNSRIEIWVDKVKGLLRQTKWELTLVPPDGIERLKDKQFLLSTTLTLEKVNENVTVDVPGQTIDMDEAARLLTGITVEEQNIGKQIDRVDSLQSMLKSYQKMKDSYPDSLDQLAVFVTAQKATCAETSPTGTSQEKAHDAKRISDLRQWALALTNHIDTQTTYPAALKDATTFFGNSVAPTDPSTGKEYEYAVCADGKSFVLSATLEAYDQPKTYSLNEMGLSVTGAPIACGAMTTATGSEKNLCPSFRYDSSKFNVTDVFTKKQFGYSKDGSDYKVTYQMQIGDSEKYSYEKGVYAEGTNTMTSKDVSLEKESSSEKYTREHPVNTNRNTNANVNTNGNANVNINSNVNRNTNVNSNVDADKDGLTDNEEVLTYGTLPYSIDTDGDGYNDKAEICGGYNPNGSGKSTTTYAAPTSGCP